MVHDHFSEISAATHSPSAVGRDTTRTGPTSRTSTGTSPRTDSRVGSGVGARRAAFTLVELLVVIGIITLLISILLPTLNKARAAANTVTCASNLRQIGVGAVAYANDFKGAVLLTNMYHDTAFSGNNNRWWVALHRGGYIGEKRPAALYYEFWRLPVSRCPEARSQIRDDTSTYAISTHVGGVGGSAWYSPTISQTVFDAAGNAQYVMRLKIGKVREPSRTVYFGETELRAPGAIDLSPVATTSSPWRAPGDYHAKGVNITFFDGHVERVLKADLLRGISLGVANARNDRVKWNLY